MRVYNSQVELFFVVVVIVFLKKNLQEIKRTIQAEI